jgi:hypothetical protein
MSLQTTFENIEYISSEYNIETPILIGESSYVRTIKHDIDVREEDSPVSVQIGYLSGNVYTVFPEIAEQADKLYTMLSKHLESGDHDGLSTLSLIHMGEEGYRLHGLTDEDDIFEINEPTLDKLLSYIKF